MTLKKHLATKGSFILLSLLLLLVTPLSITTLHATTAKNLWLKWEISNPLSKKTISHDKWQRFLSKHVHSNKEGIHIVDYKKFNQDDIALLDSYIAEMSAVNIDDYSRAQQLAYWLNLYNALTIKLISSYYPVNSIREIKISPGLFSVGPWGAQLVKVNGTDLTLDDIHNRIIRPIWNDPRTHYAINNGTIGSANLSMTAFKGELIEEQLNQAAAAYINCLRGVHIIEGKLVVSKIYEWYALDFGPDQPSIIKHLSQFAKPALKEELKSINNIEAYIYNWHLNTR